MDSIGEAAQLLDAEWGRLNEQMTALQLQIDRLTGEQQKVRAELSRVSSALRELRAPAKLLPEAQADPLLLKLTDGMGTAGGGIVGALLALFQMWSDAEATKSVRQAIQELLEAADRTWASAEILEVLQRQPNLTKAANLPNSVRNAVWQLRQAGVVVSQPDGRIVATKWPGYIASRMPDNPPPEVRSPPWAIDMTTVSPRQTLVVGAKSKSSGGGRPSAG
jgi:hypothetical protein